MQDIDGDLVAAAHLVDEDARSGDRHALRGHDGDVVSLGQMHALEQRHEAFFFYK